MVLIKIIKEGGACHAFCSYLEVKRQIWVLSCAHHLQIIINLRNYVKNIIYERLIMHMPLNRHAQILLQGLIVNLWTATLRILDLILKYYHQSLKVYFYVQDEELFLQDRIDFALPAMINEGNFIAY